MRALRIALQMAVCLDLLAIAPMASAQSTAKVHRVLVASDAARGETTEKRWRSALRHWGYVEGQNLVLQFVWAEEKPERLAGLIGERLRSNVDLILTASTLAAATAKKTTSTIPIVTITAEPVSAGLAASVARPGANVTGVYLPLADLAAKRLQLMKEVVPSVHSVAIVFNPAHPAAVAQLRSTELAARALGITVQALEFRNQGDVEAVDAAMLAKKPGGLIVMQDTVTFRASGKLAQLAARHRLPASHAYGEFADAGGLFSYGFNLYEVFVLAAGHADKLLKGARAAELPMEQPTKFELVINLKTAKALRLTVPSELLLRADRTIH